MKMNTIYNAAEKLARERGISLMEAYSILGKRGSQKRKTKRRREQSKTVEPPKPRLPYID